ncbi:MAG TPA: subclass B3 metallo-beta-lactamase [Vicinamibacterales bacterium]|nr:subclass B3 metallo-beta-lactamase [Vicinamibacterales bacterium]
MKPVVVAGALLAVLAQSSATLQPDPPHTCADCDAWNKPYEPFKVFGNTYYVGASDVSAVLITGGGGSILLDGGLPQTAPQIDAGIRKLGFRTGDIRLIVNSHAHYDHGGGIAALQRASGAAVAASAAGKRALEQGEPTADDPQFAFGRAANAFPAVKNVRAVRDGETLRVGDLAITAHLTPGHTPGATTWSWRSCEGATCYDIVYADSLNAVSAEGFRFSGGRGTPSIVESFRRSIEKIAALPCDIILSVHPSGTGMDAKVQTRRRQTSPDPFVDPNGCRAYARGAASRLEARIAEESKTK